MAYLVATVAMLFTANSYGVLSRRFPVAGSAYSYARAAIDGRVGFLVGWAVMLDYLFLPMVIWLIGASYLQSAFPAVPVWVWIIAFIVVTTGLNILGIKVADKVNFVLMTFQILVLVIFVALCVGYVVQASGPGGLVSMQPFVNPATSIGAVGAGAAIACYSFLGFDAITTLTEETRRPEHTIPRAIVLVALIGGAIFVVVTYVTTLVHEGGSFAHPDTAASDIALLIGGNLFAAVFLAGFIVTQFASGIAAQASAARLMYAMGRDGVLPRRVFSRLSPRLSTPWVAIVVSGVVGLGGMFMSVTTSTSFINFGAFLAFTMVNVSVIVLWLRDGRQGHWARHLLMPLVGAGDTIFLFTQLDKNALIIGSIWLVVGIIVLAFLSKGFRQQPPDQAGLEHHLEEEVHPDLVDEA
jgi:amino acid transporter